MIIAPPRQNLVVASRPRRQRRRLPRVGRSPASAFLEQYARTLNDPFEFPGVKLGYGCMLPTTNVCAYNRGSLSPNADGSFSVSFSPDVINLVLVNNLANNVAPSATPWQPATNFASIQTSFREARVVSGGLRVWVSMAATDKPGVLYSGTIPDYTTTEFNAATSTALRNLPGSIMSLEASGATILTRPYDSDSFAFFVNPITGYAAGGIPFMTSGYITGAGFPATATVYYEAVLNLEAIARTSNNAPTTPADRMIVPGAEAAESWFPTPGQLWRSAAEFLSTPVVADAVPGIGAAAGAAVGGVRGAQYGHLAGRAVKHLFGQGRNTWAAYSQQRARESSVIIEEMEYLPSHAGASSRRTLVR